MKLQITDDYNEINNIKKRAAFNSSVIRIQDWIANPNK